jgi:outer membrane lipoprotein SlyB
VQFRFRIGSDSSVSDTGWDVDDVAVQSCQTPTAVELSSVAAASSQSPVGPLAGLPLGALAAAALALGAGYALRRR